GREAVDRPIAAGRNDKLPILETGIHRSELLTHPGTYLRHRQAGVDSLISRPRRDFQRKSGLQSGVTDSWGNSARHADQGPYSPGSRLSQARYSVLRHLDPAGAWTGVAGDR